MLSFSSMVKFKGLLSVKETRFSETVGLMSYDVGRILTVSIFRVVATETVIDPEKSKYANEAGPPCKTGAV